MTVPDSVAVIGRYAFSRCGGLTAVTIPEGVAGIGEGAFMDCENLESAVLADSVTSLENAAFAKCPKLTLTIPHNSYIEEFCTKGRLKYIFSDAEQ